MVGKRLAVRETQRLSSKGRGGGENGEKEKEGGTSVRLRAKSYERINRALTLSLLSTLSSNVNRMRTGSGLGEIRNHE